MHLAEGRVFQLKFHENMNTTRRMYKLECVAQLRFSHDITGARTTSEPVISNESGKIDRFEKL